MKVFISWSGDLSHQVAVCLRDWLPSVIQSIVPYVSSEDIDKGARWSHDIADELSKSTYGILCVTNENISAPWLNFEAGALSKTLDSAKVSPFLFNVKRSEVNGPVLQFQSTIFEKEDVRKLAHSLRAADSDCRVTDQRLDEIFDVWWPKLEEKLSALARREKAGSESKKKSRDISDDILEQILELTRQNTRSIAQQEKILFDSLRSQLDGRVRLAGLDPDHPVFYDVARSAETILVLASHSPIESMELSSAAAKLDAALRYLFEKLGVNPSIFDQRSSVRKRRRPNEAIFSSDSE